MPHPGSPSAGSITPTHDDVAPSTEGFMFPYPKYDEPLYTEINIPLPQIPSSQPARSSSPPSNGSSSSTPPKRRSRGFSLSSLSPFGRSRSSSSSTSGKSDDSAQTRHSEEWPQVRREIVKNREVAAAMNLEHQSKRTRSATIDALAVVPALLVLSAELFTPGSGHKQNSRKKDRGVGRWEDGIR